MLLPRFAEEGDVKPHYPQNPEEAMIRGTDLSNTQCNTAAFAVGAAGSDIVI